MSHRTDSLPPQSGVASLIREMRYHEASRQILGILLSVLFAYVSRPIHWLLFASTGIVVMGIVVRLWASGFIVKNALLATNGPYALVRHPLYSGNILIIYGFAAASGIWWTIVVATAFLLFYYPPAIEYEDRKLSQRFGDAWLAFAKDTPAVMPALAGRKQSIAGTWSFKTSMTGNLEPVIAAFLLACLFFIYTRL